MAENAYVDAEKAHEYVKHHLEQDIKTYAPYVPEVQILIIPPKGSYCNAEYTFCPHLLWGGFCKELYTKLRAVDGCQFTTITDKEFWDCMGKGDRPHTAVPHGVAVGSYKVFKKQCGKPKFKGGR